MTYCCMCEHTWFLCPSFSYFFASHMPSFLLVFIFEIFLFVVCPSGFKRICVYLLLLPTTYFYCLRSWSLLFFIVSRYNSNTTKVHIFLLFVNISTYVFCLLLLSPSILCRHVYFLLLNHLLFCSDFFCPMSINAAMTFKTKLKLKNVLIFCMSTKLANNLCMRERERAPWKEQ